MKNGKITTFLQIILTLSIFSFAILAEETKEENKVISQDALNYVKKYSDFIKTKNQGEVDIITSINVSINVSDEEMKQEMIFTSSLIFQKPNKVSFITKHTMAGLGIICDGNKIYTYLDTTKKYTEKDAPENLDLVNFSIGGQGFPLAELVVSSDPEKVIMEAVKSATVLGIEKIAEQEIVKIKFEQDLFDIELWLRIGAEPLIEKIIPDMSKLIAKSLEKQKGVDAEKIAESFQKMKSDFVIEFTNWELDKDLPEDAFKFTPPQGMVKSDNLFGSMDELQGQNTEDALVGTDAPDFELKILDNKTVKLSNHKGKDIVILDFWATWCPPCKKALPIVVKATSAFKDKGVVFYAVNQDEDAETINAFLKEAGIECNVLLDKDSAVGDKYSANAIPKTVIIGKDGKIKSVHSGFSEDMGSVLVEEIQKILVE